MPRSTGSSGPTVLVTGAAGFIGRALVPALADSATVMGIDRSPPASTSSESRVSALVGDITDDSFIASLPAAGVVVHLAAATPHGPAIGDPLLMHRVNCEGTLVLLECARKVGTRSFIFASTGSVYAPQPVALSEDAPAAPRDHYSLSKQIDEELCAYYARHIPQVIVLRLFHPYGPGQGSSYLVPRLVAMVRRGEPIPVPSLDVPRRTIMYIDDLVEVLRELVLAPQRTGHFCFNVGSDEAPSVAQIARVIGEAVGREPLFEFVGGPDESLMADTSAIKRHLRSRSQVGLAEGIARMVARKG